MNRIRTREVISIALFVTCLGCWEDVAQRDDAGTRWIDASVVADAGSDSHVDTDTEDVDQDEAVTCGASGSVVRPAELQTLEGCEIVLSKIGLVDFYESEVPYVDDVRRIEGGLSIHRASGLESISRFGNLEFVGNALFLQDLPKLDDLAGLNKLEEVENFIKIAYLPITTLSGLEHLTRTGGLTLRGLPNLSSLAGLQRLSLIDGDLDVNAEEISRQEFASFLERVEVTGDIQFNGEPW